MIIQVYFSVSFALLSFKVSSELNIAVDVLVVSVELVKMLGLKCVVVGDDDVVVAVVVAVVDDVVVVVDVVVAAAVVVVAAAFVVVVDVVVTAVIFIISGDVAKAMVKLVILVPKVEVV